MRSLRHALLARLLAPLWVLCLGVFAGRAFALDVALPTPGDHVGGLAPGVITVIDPNVSRPLKPVELSYRGYPVAPLLDQRLGTSWRAAGTLVTFESQDGYLSLVPSERLLRYPAFLVYENASGADFGVEVPPLDHRVPLGPWYLVWDNLLYPQLRTDTASYWPYQVNRVGVMDSARLQALYPPMLPEQYRDGALLAREYCLACHRVNGVGGRKMPIDLAQWVTGQSYARFASWVLDPSGKNPLTTMPALAESRPAAERQRMARQIYGYLRALGALGGSTAPPR